MWFWLSTSVPSTSKTTRRSSCILLERIGGHVALGQPKVAQLRAMWSGSGAVIVTVCR
jgi:hypothetical protein